MKLALLTDGVYPFVIGGMQKHSYYLARFLAGRGVDVTLVHCVPYGKKLPSEKEVRKKMELSDCPNFRSICLHFPQPGTTPGHYLKESYLYSVKVGAALGDIHAFDFIYIKGFAGWDIMRRKKKGESLPPIGVKFHGYEMFQRAPSFKLKLQHWMLRKPTRYNNVNADVVFSYGGYITPLIEKIGVPSDRIVEIPTGIEASWVRSTVPVSGAKRKFLFIGRHERRKGVEELTEVINRLSDRTDFEFHFVGPISPTRYIKSDAVTYHGKVMEKGALQAIVDSCEVLVTPSHSEGMPNVIMEGMARGLAVIATDVGAVPAQVDDVNGWRLPPGDVEALHVAMLTAIEMNPIQLDQKRQASRQRVLDDFTWEAVSERTEMELRALCSSQVSEVS